MRHEHGRKNLARSARALCRRDGGGRAGSRTTATAAQHHLDHGRRYRHLEHRRLPPRHDGGPNAEPRPACRRGHAVHRLLRRGELHGGTRQLHHRRVADPHRPDHGRTGRLADRNAGRGADHRHRVEVDGLRHRSVRQEPPGRPEPVPADGARLRRVLRLSLSPRRDGRPLPSQLSGRPSRPRSARATWSTATRPMWTIRRCSRAGARSASRRSRTTASCVRSEWRRWTTKSSPMRSSSSTRPGRIASRSSCGSIRPGCTSSRTCRRNTRACATRTTGGPKKKPAWRNSTTSSAR